MSVEEIKKQHERWKARNSTKFQCPECKRISHNPNDLKNRFCANCNKFFPEEIK
jgi:ribosomal protein L37AE/L43A